MKEGLVGVLRYDPSRVSDDRIDYVKRLLDNYGARYSVSRSLEEDDPSGFVFSTGERVLSGLKELILVLHGCQKKRRG